MITPIEQSPNLVFDPARQQITPPPVIQPQPLPALTETPVRESSSSNKQNFGSDGGGDKTPEQQAQSDTAQKLRAAWAYLQQLKSEVSMALSGGYADNVKRAALKAAEVASSIVTLSMQIPVSGGEQVMTTNAWLPPSFVGMTDDGQTNSFAAPSSSDATVASSDSFSGTGTVSAVSLVDLARGGLGAAKEVIVEAASAPQFTANDRVDINALMQRVLNSMAVVEQIAERLPLEPGTQTAAVPNRVDFEA